jgi:subtilisin-like proprotein convertase family protein
MKSRYTYRFCLLVLSIVLLSMGSALFPQISQADAPSPEQIVQRAWQHASALGVYRFATEVTQTTFPAPALSNVGRSSQQDTLYLEGQVDLPAHVMQISLWQGGSAADSTSAIEVRLEGEQGYGRAPGGSWQEIDSFADAFAPGNDLMAYLAGAKNIHELSGGTSRPSNSGLNYYAFDLDGPDFANHLREQLETLLRDKGQLPPGLTLDSSNVYRQMDGSGEIWIDSDGLPVRLLMHITYPEQSNGERVEADIQTDFFGFDRAQLAVVLSGPARLATTLGLPKTQDGWRAFGQQAVMAAATMGVLTLLVIYGRSRQMYVMLVFVLIFSMVVSPLLQSNQVYAFMDRLHTEQAERERREQTAEAASDLQETLASNWEPNQNPLETGVSAVSTVSDPVVDSDGDGLSDADEALLGTNPFNADSDGDLLNDGTEVMRLGTNPLNVDSDADGIRDDVEVRGVVLSGQTQRWYLNPNHPDTNGDGVSDGVECPELMGVTTTPAGVTCDADGDGVLDPFDDDNDNDGVLDRVDLSPNGMMDRNGKRASAGTVTPFAANHPMALQVNSLTAGYPAFVDFQLRPITASHLTYALSVFDWPTGDLEGQIQRGNDTTFATTDNLTARNTADPRAANGDMRLVPMLEIEIKGNSNGYQVPLALTTPAITVTVRGEVSATVRMEQHPGDVNKTDLTFNFAAASGYYVTANAGPCTSDYSHNPADYPCFINGSSGTCTVDGNVVDLADGAHVIRLAGPAFACEPIGNIVNGLYRDKMVDPAPLAPFGISVREADAAGTLLAYAPLNVVPDETGGGRAAFAARMLYWPGVSSAWQQAQNVRVVWVVQMLTDWCDITNFTPSAEAEADTAQYNTEHAAWCVEHRSPDQLQVVHTYDEEWYLTGLAVREDRGMDVAIIAENPATDPTPDAEDALWQMARGLQAVFVPGRDCEDSNPGNGEDYITSPPSQQRCRNDGKRDIVVAPRDNGNTTIASRFSVTTTSTTNERWGIPANAMLVRTFSYTHENYLAWIAMRETRALLQDHFGASATPTLLFAREETFRSANAESGSVSSGILTLDLGSGAPTTMTGLSWSPYRYNANLGPDGQVIGWETYPMSEYWDKMEVAFEAGFRNVYPDESDKTIIGRMVAARSFYVALNAGTSGLVSTGGQPTWSPPWLSGEPADDSNVALAGGVGSIIINSYWVISDIIDAFVQEAIKAFQTTLEFVKVFYAKPTLNQKASAFLDCLGDGVKGVKASWLSAFNPANTFGKMGTLGKVGLGVMVGVAVAAVALTIYAATQADNALDVVSYVMSALNVVILLKSLMSAVKEFVETGVQATRAALTNATKWGQNACSKVAVIGLVIGILVTWAVLAVTLALSQLSHIQQGYVIARAVADTIVLVIMFIVNAIPIIGPIIANVIWLIDALIATLCGVFGWSEEEEGDMDPYNDAGDWLCGGLEGIVSTTLAWFFYAGTIMVDMDAADRFQISGIDTNDLLYPDKGMTVGNAILAGASFTNTIDLVDRPNNIGTAYWYEWSDERLRSSAFAYELQAEEIDLHEGLERNTMSNDWHYVDGTAPPVGDALGWWHVAEPVFITRTVRSTDGFALTEAGINQPLPVILSEGWAIPAQECVLGVCGIRTERDTRHYNLGDGIKLDVFPATLDDFTALQSKAGGLALAWGQTGDVTFPGLRDADNDGLPASADPDDSRWDSDGDGLSDYFERQIGSDPGNRDGDGDGLGDALEARLGMSPSRPDTDGDGLWDGQEVFHQDVFDRYPPSGNGNTTEWVGGWLFAYALDADNAPLTTWVAPDPLNADVDRDTLSDYQEYTFGFNPNVLSTANVLMLQSQVQELTASGTLTPSDGVVRAGSTFHYAATVKNELDLRYAQGLLDTDFPASLTSAVPPQTFVLQPQEQRVMDGSVAVPAAAASGTYSLTQVAGALITDWGASADSAALWLPFEDPVGSTTFLDRSGAIPVHNGTCVGSACTLVKSDGRYGGALQLNGSSYVTSAYDPSETNYTLSLWFKTAQAEGGLFSVGDQGVQVSLEDGNVCARVPYNWGTYNVIVAFDTRCTWDGGYNDNEWHHIVQTFGGTAGAHTLYVDGVLVGQGFRTSVGFPSTRGVDIGRALDDDGLFTSYVGFNGLLDDVRIYADGMSALQVKALFDQPVFYMRFDETSGWRDNSIFDNDGSCTTTTCPTRVTSSVAGKAAQFDGSAYLSIDADSSLNLSAGRFTISAWMNPNSNSPTDCVQTYYNTCQMVQPQGVLGLNSSEANAYPTLQRAGRKVRFGIGTGSTPMPYYLSGEVLTENAWNHVVVTFDRGVLRLYVNGELRATDTTTFPQTPGETQRFTLGRSGDQATLDIGSIAMTGCDDEGVDSTCELCIAYSSGGSWTEVFNQSVKMSNVTPTIFDVDKTVIVYGTGTLRMWEDDGGVRCGEAPDGKSPTADDDIGTWTFSTNDVSTEWRPGYIRGYESEDFSGQVVGSYSFLYDNDSIPFYGKLDEVKIYQHVLDGNAVLDLYRNTAVAAKMNFDEPPGESSFANEADSSRQGTCSGTSCPTTGVAGRVNQAAWFVPSEQDHVTLPDLGDFGTVTVAAWVYRNGSTTARESIVSYKEHAGCGFTLALNENGSSQYPRFRVKIGTTWEYAEQVTAIPLNTWVHLAGTYDGQTLRLYRNGALVSSKTVSGAMSQCSAYSAIGSRSSGTMHYFPGQIDDVHIYGRALAAAELSTLYDRAPVLQMHMEEARGATQFVVASGSSLNGSCDAASGYCPQAGEAIQGRLGQAVEFDGRGDKITVSDAAALDLNLVTVGAWVKPTAVSGYYPQEIVGKYGYAGYGLVKDNINYNLYLQSNSLVPAFAVNNQGFCGAAPYKVTSAAPLIKDQWNHVLGTFDGQRLRIYVNGALQGTYNAPAALTPCKNNEPLRIGGYESNYPYRMDTFAGRIDEVTLYNRALTESEARELYAYQAGWVEDREVHNITIDADDPTAVLTGTTAYLPDQDVQWLILAHDPTSLIVDAELGACKSTGTCDTSSYTWTSASMCSDAAGDGAWCPRFFPSDEGRYLVRGRVADQVGNGFTTGDTVVYVDDGAPTVGFNFAADARLDAKPNVISPEAWSVYLSGTVSDPALADNSAGSGVRADGVWVTLHAADGGLSGAARQQATVDGNTWSVTYRMDNAPSSGFYTVTVEAADEVTRLPELSEEQRALHTAVATRRIQVDALAPAIHLDQTRLPSSGITGAASLSGDVTERPVPLTVSYTPVDGLGHQVGLTLTCSGVVYNVLPPGTLPDAAATYHWSGTAHSGASCQVTTSGNVAGTVRVCDSDITSWTAASTGVSFTATAPTCAAGTAIAGVGQPQFALSPVQYGSPFFNELPPEGQVLHLPLDDTRFGNAALTFNDVSGRGHDGACSGAACPDEGQPGRLGYAVHFDGVDDRVNVPDSADFRFGTGPFAVSLWLQLDRTDNRYMTILSKDRNANVGFSLIVSEGQLRVRMTNYNSPAWVVLQGGAVSPGVWHHVVVTRDGSGNVTTYIDGAASGSGVRTTDMNLMQAPLRLGAPTYDAYGVHFQGLLDDVRLFNRSLSAAQVKALYRGTGPALVLPLDEAWAGNGSTLPDLSGAERTAALHTGANDAANKATAGAVGSYALSFDGVNDFVGIASDAGLSLNGGRYTLAAWIYPTPLHDGSYPILSSAAYHEDKLQYPFVQLVNRTQLAVGFGNGSTLNTFTTGSILTENAWNHVGVTFDGTTTTVYVNGVARATTDEFAGQTPRNTLRFDLGRGRDIAATHTCGRVTWKTITPNTWGQLFYVVFGSGGLFQAPWNPVPDRAYAINRANDFCGTDEISVYYYNAGSVTLLGQATVDATPGSYSRTFAAAGQSATVTWDVTTDPAQLLYFRGALDDIRVYPRALSSLELQELYNGLWRNAGTAPGTPGVAWWPWNAQIPTGLEGYYRLDLRAPDRAGHVSNAGQNVWQGSIDTLSPRLALTRTLLDASTYRYAAQAQDWNLSDAGFQSPCGTAATAAPEYYQSPWYVGRTGDALRLYELTTQCDLPLWAMTGEVGVYEGAGMAAGITISGSIAYLADGSGGLRVIDVSNPALPVLLGTYDTPGYAYAVALAGSQDTQALAAVAEPDWVGVPHVLAAPSSALSEVGIPQRAESVARTSASFMLSVEPLAANPQPSAEADNVNAPTAVFTVTATSPAGNGRVVARDGVISATFSQPVSTTTVTSRTFAVRGLQTAVYTGSYTFVGPVTLTPAVPFKPGETIVASLSDGIAATGGDVLVPYAWEFRAAVQGGTGVLTDSTQRLGNALTRAAVLGDLDGDGDVDAFTGNDGANLVWLNDGLGQFTGNGQTLGISQTTSLALGDVDGDGDLDAWVGNGDVYGAEPDQVWLNDGLGNFTDSGQTLAMSQTTSVALADLDGDGDLDAMAGNAVTYDFDCLPDPCPLEGGSRVWLNDGTGVFTTSGQLLGLGTDNQSVALGDLNGDGLLDALIGNRGIQWASSNWGGGETQVWLNNGGGAFTALTPTLGYANTRAVALGDLDGDGDLDAFVGNYNEPNTVWLNDGTGVLVDTGQTLGNAGTETAALGDLDGDGDLDVLAGNGSEGSRVWLNNGAGTFTDSGRSMPVQIESGSINAVALADLDGDGDLDAYLGVVGDPDAADMVWINNANTPIANDDTFTVPENSTANYLDVLANDTDADGDTLSVLSVGDPVTGSASALSSMVVYTPALGFSGAVVFTYTVSDPGGLTATATLTVTVSGGNDPPEAVDDTAETNEDVPVTIDVVSNDTDPNLQTLFVSALGAPLHGSTALVGEDVRYTPSADYNGSDSFTYVVSDGTLTDTATVTVTIAAVNDPPSFTRGADQTVDEDSGLHSVSAWATNIRPGPVTAVDETGQTLTFTLTTDNDALFSALPAIDPAGMLTFTPAPDAYGVAEVTARLHDSGGTANGGQDTSPPQIFTITVTSVNDPPVASDVIRTIAEDTSLNLTIVPTYASDPADGDAVSLLAVGAPGYGVASIVTPQALVYTPTLDFFGSDTFTYTVGDPGGLTATARVTVTVTPVNDPPTLDALTDLVIDEDAPTQIVPLSGITSGAANEAQVLTVTATSTNTALIPNPLVTYASPNVTGTLSFAPLPDQYGVATLRVTVNDGFATVTRTFRVTVRPVVKLAYVADGGGGLRMVDVANPTLPRLIGTYAPGWTISDVAVSGTLAFVAAGSGGLIVVDVSEPNAPYYLGSFGAYDSAATGVTLAGDLAYVADSHYKRLRIVNVADPAHPAQVGVYTTTATVYDTVVSGTLAYVAAAYGGLHVLDVSDPANPHLLGKTPQYGMNDARGVTISGTLAYVADGPNGLRVVDVANPAQPHIISTFDTPGYALGLALVQNLVGVADYNSGLRIINPDGLTPRVQACDTAGNCTTENFATQALAAAPSASAQAQADDLSVAILNVPAILDSVDPITVTGRAEAFVSSLRALTLTVDGVPIYITTWPSGALTETVWSAGWTPAEGQRVLEAHLTDWSANVATATLTTTVDTQPPELSITPVYTAVSYYEPRMLAVTGLLTDTGGVAHLWLGPSIDDLRYEATITGNTWQAAWSLDDGPLPDGDVLTITAEATDIVGHKTQLTQTVMADLVPPAPVSPALAYDGTPLSTGDTVRALSPTLELTWPASSDGSGLAGYRVRWLTQVTGTAQISESFQTTQLSAYAAGDGQQVSAYVAGEDVYGQQSWQGIGPIYVDSPLTPDYVWMGESGTPYLEWMTNGCTWVGTDRRAAQYSARLGEQRFYVTWGMDALRLAWTGANWNIDGDLFIYLDTQPGGAATAFDPYRTLTATTMISFPTGMAADTLLWVRDAATALLLQWDGAQWITPTLLSSAMHQFDAALNGGQTDLYVPFDLLGLDPQNALSLVALAAAPDSLDLWATMPNGNLLNGVEAAPAAEGAHAFALTHNYHWDSLGTGICPNGSTGGAGTPYLDSDVKVSLTADPPGTVYSLLGDNLFWLQDLLLGSPPADVTSYLNGLDTAVSPLGDGQTVTYALHYRNQGTYTATQVTAEISAAYALALTPGDETVLLGDIGPGEEGAVTFSGVVDTGLSPEPWAAMTVAITDDAHPSSAQPLEWLWAHHPVDNRAPEFFGFRHPGYVVGPGTVAMSGYAYDDSGVLEITVEVQGSPSFVCPDATPGDGHWLCEWDTGNAVDGDLLSVRLRAVDGAGQDAWSPPFPFLVDARPPTVTLSLTATQVVSGSLLRDTALMLSGVAEDDGSGVAQVSVCLEDNCGAANMQLSAGATPVRYEDVPDQPVAIGVACETRLFTVTEAFAVAQVALGFVAEHPHRDDLDVELISPAGTHVQVLADDGISGSAFRHYDVLLDDAATVSLTDAQGDDDPSGMFYDRLARPYAPLQAFQGEQAQGVWQLRVCDTDLSTNVGNYIRSRLMLAPRDTAIKSAQWSYQTPPAGALDYVSRTITIAGQDVVGNRDADPLSLLVWVDNVAPILTVTEALTEFFVSDGITTVLRGLVTDGGPAMEVSLLIQMPDGSFEKAGAARDGDTWWFDLPPWYAGTYTLWIQARDLAGNVTTVGPFTVEVEEYRYRIFMPLVARDLVPPPPR